MCYLNIAYTFSFLFIFFGGVDEYTFYDFIISYLSFEPKFETYILHLALWQTLATNSSTHLGIHKFTILTTQHSTTILFLFFLWKQ